MWEGTLSLGISIIVSVYKGKYLIIKYIYNSKCILG